MHAELMLALLGPVGPMELLIILAIVILIFGANRLSGLGKGLGQAIRGFKEEVRIDEKTQSSEASSTPPPASRSVD
jgi:sec-independent protein translocase protein TatA